MVKCAVSSAFDTVSLGFQWLEQVFGAYASAQELEQAGRVLDGFLKINSLRRPESLHAEIYHPAHYDESRRMMQLCDDIDAFDTVSLGFSGRRTTWRSG